MNYELVPPEDFTDAHRSFIDAFRRSIDVLSSQTDVIVGAKDIHSRHVIATDAYARLVGLVKGADVTGRLDCEMPCEGTARFADCHIREDRELLCHRDADSTKSILKVYEYSDGLKALVFDKFVMKHHASRSILGIIYHAHEVDVAHLFALLPNYSLEFGSDTLERAHLDEIVGCANLTEYEYEVGFLIAMNWSVGQISRFMNRYRPTANPRVADTIYKCKDRICEKLGIDDCRVPVLREKLLQFGIHRKMPRSFFKRILGSRQL